MIKVRQLGELVHPTAIARAGPALVQACIADVMEGARAKWISAAQERLTSTRRDYVGGIQTLETTAYGAALTLLGSFPNMIEHGAPAFDMHDTLLGPNVSVAGPGGRGKHALKGGGYYRVIPLSHSSPTASGASGGAPMGSAHAKALPHVGMELGKQVFKAAKKLAGSTSLPGEGTKWGERLPEGMVPKLKPHHTTDIYAGMVRMEKTYAKSKQSTYKTFRVISDNVPGKWMHPGIQPANLLKVVDEYVHENLQKTVMAALRAATGGAP